MRSTITTTLVIALSVLSSGRFVSSAVADDYKPELFKSVKLIYAENFGLSGSSKPSPTPKRRFQTRRW